MRLPIYVSHLSLSNIRNYESLELELGAGMILMQGENGNGKSNLLEALYMLAIAKSARASTDREMVRRQAVEQRAHAQVLAVAQRNGSRVRVQIDFISELSPGEEGVSSDAEPSSIQKSVRVNGVPRRASALVGEINAVMFSAQDLGMVTGPPSARRRYVDILISQLEQPYLRALQRYQRVLSQRNHLLKSARGGHAGPGELEFWDDEMVNAGAQIVGRRAETVRMLSERAGLIHRELTGGGESLELVYRPNVDLAAAAGERETRESLRRALEANRTREAAQGFTVTGPHRDDVRLMLDGMDAGMYASRGQSRTAVLAMRLAEAQHLSDRRGHEPVLLLDDVLSELDAGRRSHVLDRVGGYQQCIITTTDIEPIQRRYLSQMARFVVRDGRVEPAE